MSVEFQADNFPLLEKAAKNMGLKMEVRGQAALIHTQLGTITISNGQASGPEQAVSLTVNSLRVNYSREIVKAASMKMGWGVQFLSQNKMVVRKT